MTYRVVISPSANRDVDRLEDWLAERSPQAALRVGGVLKAAFLSLADMPHRTWRIDEGVRELMVPFGRYGYVIRYEVRESRVIVTRVFHALEDR